MIKGIAFLLLMTFLFASLMIGQSVYKSDMETNHKTDIYNLTESIDANFSCDYLYDNDIAGIPKLKSQRINKIVCSFAEFLVTAGIETAKLGVEFGYENPQYDYNFYIRLFKLYLYIVLLSIIIPLIALFYIIYSWIFTLIMKIKEKRRR